MTMSNAAVSDPMFTPADWAMQAFNPLDEFRNQENMLTGFQSTFPAMTGHIQRVAHRDQRLLSPIANADLIETGTSYDVWIDVPGVEDVECAVHNGILTISADRKHTYEKDMNFIHKLERTFGKVCRCISLPTNANGDHAKATYKNGVLHIQIPKVKNGGVKRAIQVEQDAVKGKK